MAWKKRERESPDELINRLLPDVSCEVDHHELWSVALLPVRALQTVWDALMKRMSIAERNDVYRGFRKDARNVEAWFSGVAKNADTTIDSAAVIEFSKDGAEWVDGLLNWTEEQLGNPPTIKMDQLQDLVERRDSLMGRYAVLHHIGVQKGEGSRTERVPGDRKSRTPKRRKRAHRVLPTTKQMEALSLVQDGKTFRQIGEELGISHEAARQRVLRAKKIVDKRVRSVRTQALPTDRRGQVTTEPRKGKVVKKPIEDD